MVVVADTSPIRYLLLIGLIQLLPELFGDIIVPPAVWLELRNPSAPEAVRRFMSSPPDWIHQKSLIAEPRAILTVLDAGEREALELALQLQARLVLIDESEGRQAALRVKLEVRGTIGILIEAAVARKIDLTEALDKLARTSFYITPVLRDFAIQSALRKGTP